MKQTHTRIREIIASGGVHGARPHREKASAGASALTLRVLLLAPLLIVLNAWWIVEIEYIRYSDNCTTQSLFF